MRILAVNSLAVNGALPLYVESKGVLQTLYSIKKCIVHFMKRRTRSPCFSRWWKARLGKCYFQMGMYREAEKQFKSAIKDEDNVRAILLLSDILIDSYFFSESVVLGFSSVFDDVHHLMVRHLSKKTLLDTI